MFRCPKCGGRDFTDQEQYLTKDSEKSKVSNTTKVKLAKCITCNFESVIPLKQD
ncbi:MAG: hypothetical protein MRJ93_00340 [Nitrososphaeraceae archaeon]|nr:hypothetical protein [Nitrososphaeraceae archaeon]